MGDEVLVTLSNKPKIVHVYKRAKTQITGSMIQRKKEKLSFIPMKITIVISL